MVTYAFCSFFMLITASNKNLRHVYIKQNPIHFHDSDSGTKTLNSKYMNSNWDSEFSAL